MLDTNEMNVLLHELLYIATTDCTDFYNDDYDDVNDFFNGLNHYIDCYKNNAIQIIKLCNDYNLHIKFIGRSNWENETYKYLYYDDLNGVYFGDDDLLHLIDNDNNVVLVINDYCQCIELNRYMLDDYIKIKYKTDVITQNIIDNYNIRDME